jgi:hypothetical protein
MGYALLRGDLGAREGSLLSVPEPFPIIEEQQANLRTYLSSHEEEPSWLLYFLLILVTYSNGTIYTDRDMATLELSSL